MFKVGFLCSRPPLLGKIRLEKGDLFGFNNDGEGMRWVLCGLNCRNVGV